MTISAKVWKAYIAKLRAINDKAADEMRAWLRVHGTADRNAMIDYAFALAQKYGDASATLSASMYDAVARRSGKYLSTAMPAEPASMKEVARAVVGAAKSGNYDIVADAVGRLVKLAGVDTTMYNAIRDGAEWAWVPVGDTCAYCVALAANGWQRASMKALEGGHAEHIHANCDCTYAIRFDERGSVDGYDPDKWRGMYLTADLDGDAPTSDNRINALRRQFYQQNRETILAQKRDAYEKSRELESSAAEEVRA